MGNQGQDKEINGEQDDVEGQKATVSPEGLVR